MEAIYNEEGRVIRVGNAWEFQYALRDHFPKGQVGSTRVLFKPVLNAQNQIEPQIIQQNHHYPFGGEMEGAWNNQTNPEQNYLYNNNELQTNFGLNVYDFKKRTYDPTIGRFWQIDPLSEHPKLLAYAPYHFSVNNPIRYNDPNGDCPPWICGAIAGAALDVGIQVLVEGKSFSEVNYKEVAASAALGAVGGGLIGKAGKLLKAGKKAKKSVETGKKS